MPAKTKHTAAAQRARKRLKGRGAKQNPVRKRGQGTETAAAVIADSIFTLKLEPKKGTDLYFAFNGDAEQASIKEVYKDLYASYAQICMGVKGEETRDLTELGMSIPSAFHQMLCNLKYRLLPHGYEFNVERDETGKSVQKHFFVIYHKCDWELQWNQLEVGPTLLHLAKHNKPLHDLFISFLASFRKCGLDLWSEGFMGATLDFMRDTAEEYEDYNEKEIAKSINDALDKYSTGIPSKYEKLIIKAPELKPSEMRRRAKLFKKDQEIANLIHQGSFIIEAGCNLYRYRYDAERPEDGWDIFLDLDSQCNIIWSFDDAFGQQHQETLDCEANNGYVQEPIWHRAITRDSKEFDFVKWAEEIRWPKQLILFFDNANHLLFEYHKKIKK